VGGVNLKIVGFIGLQRKTNNPDSKKKAPHRLVAKPPADEELFLGETKFLRSKNFVSPLLGTALLKIDTKMLPPQLGCKVVIAFPSPS
jgi:hypothetical protein